MLTKEKIIAAIQAMPETEFEDIEVLLECIVELQQIETGIKQIKEGKIFSQEKVEQMINNELQEPTITYGTSKMALSIENKTDTFSPENDAEMMAHIDKKLNEATDPETIYLIKKIKRGIEDSRAGRGITIEEMEKKVQSWFR